MYLVTVAKPLLELGDRREFEMLFEEFYDACRYVESLQTDDSKDVYFNEFILRGYMNQCSRMQFAKRTYYFDAYTDTGREEWEISILYLPIAEDEEEEESED